MTLSNQDIRQITNHGLTITDIETQIANFVRGFPFADIVRPATTTHGEIQELNQLSRKKYTDIYNEYRKSHTVVKFVPASGAATRMFRDLFEFLESGVQNNTVQTVCRNIKTLALGRELNITPNACDSDVIRTIVNEYGSRPKALVPFHIYTDEIRTPVAEHMFEGAKYATSRGDIVNIHFTVSPEHRAELQKLIDKIIPEYSARYGVKYNITMSVQKSSTDTIAVNPDNTPFRTSDGALLFRPAGHGALIENLDAIDSDIIFIKNIDNVCHQGAMQDTVEYKCALAGILVDIQAQIFEYIRQIKSGTCDTNEIHRFIQKILCMDVAPNADEMLKILNRPVRVCGMVKNIGAPGGGPFIVRHMGPQIVESSQIAPEMRKIMNTATHFNPVDLVCGVRDYMGDKFNLNDFIDENAGFISEKSHVGRPLRAMERPGLWNGAMAHWNTVFVEIPGTTFTPVKTVADLATAAHMID